MAVRQLRFEGDEILKKKCREVSAVDDHVRQLLEDMMDTLHQTENGAALAANQVGILRRLIVIDYCGEQLRLVNPKIVEESGTQECVEGCLSFPNRYVKTIRPQSVTVEALDEQGRPLRLTGEGEMAKCYCHEIDHLDGKIFLDISIGDA